MTLDEFSRAPERVSPVTCYILTLKIELKKKMRRNVQFTS